jgi:hypothetical protein
MAGRGRPRKPAGAVADPRNGVEEVPIEQARAELGHPEPPARLLASVQGEWDEFWASDVALLMQPSDFAAVRRLFLLRDERERCYREIRKTKTTRLILAEALKVGAVGELRHEIDDEGETHSYIEVRHDGRIGIGSQGQMVLSPWARDLRSIDAEIRQLEDRFGLNTRARVGIGATVRINPGSAAASAPTEEPEGADDGDRKVLDAL